MADTTVNIKVADLEPFARFIGKIVEANNALLSLSAEEAKVLPADAAKGIAKLQSALRELSKEPVSPVRTEGSQPTQFHITMDPPPASNAAYLTAARQAEAARRRDRS